VGSIGAEPVVGSGGCAAEAKSFLAFARQAMRTSELNRAFIHLFIHSFIHFNSGSKAHKTTDKSSDIKAYTNIKAQKDRQTDREYTERTVQKSVNSLIGLIGVGRNPERGVVVR